MLPILLCQPSLVYCISSSIFFLLPMVQVMCDETEVHCFLSNIASLALTPVQCPSSSLKTSLNLSNTKYSLDNLLFTIPLPFPMAGQSSLISLSQFLPSRDTPLPSQTISSSCFMVSPMYTWTSHHLLKCN